MRALIDTCIVIDALQAREPFSTDAQNIFLAVANKRYVGFLTAKSATDIYYLTHRHIHCEHETRQILHTLFSLFELLDTTGMDCRQALSSELTDYEDAIMVESALRGGIDCIVTRNLKDYPKSPIQVYSPSGFLAQIEEDVEKDEIE